MPKTKQKKQAAANQQPNRPRIESSIVRPTAQPDQPNQQAQSVNEVENQIVPIDLD